MTTTDPRLTDLIARFGVERGTAMFDRYLETAWQVERLNTPRAIARELREANGDGFDEQFVADWSA